MARNLAKKSVVKKTSKKVKVTSPKKIPAISKSYTKTELLQRLADHVELPKKKIVEVIETLQSIMFAHLKAGRPFCLPGVLKLTVVKKPATKARKGINPFTGEPTTFKPKPAHKKIKMKALSKLKGAV
ncbi:MAG: HU family DNA-binding protein [Rickettsiella sp.]|nr:HU family DNA-binding protein [Rickettsiella sp.]